MTIKEYNKEFLPQVNGAKTFVNALDHIIEKVFTENITDKEGLKKLLLEVLSTYGWSEETKQLILNALECYRVHEGIDKLDSFSQADKFTEVKSMKVGDIVKSKATGKLYKIVSQKEGRNGFHCDSISNDDDSQYYFFDEEVDVISENEANEETISIENLTIKEYASMPKVEINGKVFVDKELFRGYALHLLTQELKDEMSSEEQLGIETAIHVIANIK